MYTRFLRLLPTVCAKLVWQAAGRINDVIKIVRIRVRTVAAGSPIDCSAVLSVVLSSGNERELRVQRRRRDAHRQL